VDPQFNDIYEELYINYPQEVSEEERQLVHRIKDLIDGLGDELGLSERLRPDAKFYLLVNPVCKFF